MEGQKFLCLKFISKKKTNGLLKEGGQTVFRQNTKSSSQSWSNHPLIEDQKSFSKGVLKAMEMIKTPPQTILKNIFRKKTLPRRSKDYQKGFF